MGSEWPICKLGDIAQIKGGKRLPKGMQLSAKRNSHPYIRVVDFNDGKISLSDLQYVPDDVFPYINRYTVKVDDIIISIVGTIGLIAKIPHVLNGANLTENAAKILIKVNSVVSGFFSWYLKSSVGQFEIGCNTVGSTQPKLPLYGIRNIKCMLPPLPEQRAIAHILGSLDDKIELNRQMNQTLEAMAQAIFKSWFVDFDPVKAKIEGRDTGLPAEIADLFPDSFEESELGQIPKGWKVRTISDLAEVVGGSTPSTTNPSFWKDGTYHWTTPKDLSSLSVPVLLDTDRCITDAGLAQISSGLLPIGTVLLSSRAPIGYLAIAEIPVAINQGFIAMKAIKGTSNLFLLQWTKCAHDDILSRANGSTFLEISKSNFRPILLVVPPDKIMQTFDKVVRPLYEHIVSNEYEIKNLIKTRDALLPKLISGEMRVPDVEALI